MVPSRPRPLEHGPATRLRTTGQPMTAAARSMDASGGMFVMYVLIGIFMRIERWRVCKQLTAFTIVLTYAKVPSSAPQSSVQSHTTSTLHVRGS